MNFRKDIYERVKYIMKEQSEMKVIRLADILENQPLAFDDGLIRQMLQCVVVQSKDCIKVIFNDGTEIDQPLQ